jgi:hypothetical protein
MWAAGRLQRFAAVWAAVAARNSPGFAAAALILGEEEAAIRVRAGAKDDRRTAPEGQIEAAKRAVAVQDKDGLAAMGAAFFRFLVHGWEPPQQNTIFRFGR